ncbi:MAG: hypothetical protein Kilf2KO_43240 [Rhodospirillales bacterium]
MKNAGEKQTNSIVVEAERRMPDDAATTAVTFDPQRYRQELEGCADLTETQAEELLLAVWEIMKAFVHLGWGVDSIHHVLPDLAAIATDLEAADSEADKRQARRQFGTASHTRSKEEIRD